MSLQRGFMVIGHRGAAGLEPENTMRSFRRAVAIGVDAVELDVRVVDDTLIVLHDDTLERTTNGSGPIRERDLAALRALDAGLGERIPLLREVMEAVGSQVPINVELKGVGSGALLASMLPSLPPCDLLVSSFRHDELLVLRAAQPSLRVAPLFGRHGVGMWRIAERLSAWAINVSQRLATPHLLAAIRDRGYRALVYTINDLPEAERLKRDGASGVFTDYPDRMQALRE
jgi:glycerophosphoryl diester phosphodiesterase